MDTNTGTTPAAPMSEKPSGSPFGNIHRKKRGRMPKLLEFVRGELRPVFDKLLLFIEQGAYDHVAARAMGVHPQTWSKWMGRGAVERKGLYREFYLEVTTARGKARLLKELEVARDDPKFWLRCGPGKTREGDPGWTDQLALVGDPEAPIEMRVEHDTDGLSEEEHVNDLATTLLLLQQLGFASITDSGKNVVQTQPKQVGRPNYVVDEAPDPKPPTTPSPTPSEDDDEDDDGKDGEDKGYFPERPELGTLSGTQKRKLLPGQIAEPIVDPDDLPPPPDFA